MIDVECKVRVCEKNGKEVPVDHVPLKVSSHWNVSAFVVLTLPDGMQYTVNRSDLEAAIKNATNTNR